jgi:hypothetical protein
MTEHAAVIFVFFFLAEYTSIVLICVLTSILFLGGYLIDITPLIYIYNSISNIFQLGILSIVYLSLNIVSGIEFLTFKDISLNFSSYHKDDILLTIQSIIMNFNVLSADNNINITLYDSNLFSNNFITGLFSSIILGVKTSMMVFVFI